MPLLLSTPMPPQGPALISKTTHCHHNRHQRASLTKRVGRRKPITPDTTRTGTYTPHHSRLYISSSAATAAAGQPLHIALWPPPLLPLLLQLLPPATTATNTNKQWGPLIQYLLLLPLLLHSHTQLLQCAPVYQRLQDDKPPKRAPQKGGAPFFGCHGMTKITHMSHTHTRCMFGSELCHAQWRGRQAKPTAAAAAVASNAKAQLRKRRQEPNQPLLHPAAAAPACCKIAQSSTVLLLLLAARQDEAAAALLHTCSRSGWTGGTQHKNTTGNSQNMPG